MTINKVETGLLRGTYDAVILSTDLEPDDIVAIRALSEKLRGVNLLVVVGEGFRGCCVLSLAAFASFAPGVVDLDAALHLQEWTDIMLLWREASLQKVCVL